MKQIFDPGNVLNPGKIVGDDPESADALPAAGLDGRGAAAAAEQPRRRPSRPKLRDLVELQLNWDPARVTTSRPPATAAATAASQSPEVRMCPIFRFAPAEEASPRAKANLIRGFAHRRHRAGPR